MAAKKTARKKKALSQKKAEPKIKKPDIRVVAKYAGLLTEKIQADDRIKKINAELEKLHHSVLDYFQRQNIPQIAVGDRTLYLKREIHTNKSADVTQQQACEKLREIGLSEYAGERANTNGLAAYVRDLEADGQELQSIEEQFGGAFHCVELFKIGSRKR